MKISAKFNIEFELDVPYHFPEGQAKYITISENGAVDLHYSKPRYDKTIHYWLSDEKQNTIDWVSLDKRYNTRNFNIKNAHRLCFSLEQESK